MVGNEGIEPNRPTTAHALKGNAFTERRAEHFPKTLVRLRGLEPPRELPQ